jgi:hypothetical protein
MPDSNCACRIGLNAARCFKGHFIVADHYRVIHRPRTTPRPAEEIIRSDTGSETGSIQVAARRQIGPPLKPGTFPETSLELYCRELCTISTTFTTNLRYRHAGDDHRTKRGQLNQGGQATGKPAKTLHPPNPKSTAHKRAGQQRVERKNRGPVRGVGNSGRPATQRSNGDRSGKEQQLRQRKPVDRLPTSPNEPVLVQRRRCCADDRYGEPNRERGSAMN